MSDKQDAMIEILKETLKWIKVTSIPHVRKLLLDMLPSDDEKIAYHFSDGEHGSQEVAKSVDISYVTVTKWWKKWARAGIAEMISVRGGERARHLFLLEDFGIEAPQPKSACGDKGEAKAPVAQEESKEEKKNE
jgi:hypothetical protein